MKKSPPHHLSSPTPNFSLFSVCPSVQVSFFFLSDLARFVSENPRKFREKEELMKKLMISGVISGDALVVLPSSSSFSGFSCCRKLSTFSDPKLFLSAGIVKSFHSFSIAKTRRLDNYRTKGLMVRASGDSNDNPTPIAPLRFESPTGQLLEQILQTHPHLLPAAIDQHLENLQVDRDSQKEEAPPPAQDLLYRRISEVKEKDRRKALEEIIYCLVVQKFMDNDISMIPSVSVSSDPSGMVGFWPNQEQKLEFVHSPESFEMIQSHLSLVLGERAVGPLDNFVKMSKLKLGKLYAASIMYGYFLKRVDQRFQLERSMKTLPEGFEEEEQAVFREPIPESPFWDPDSLIMIPPDDDFGDAEGGSLDSRDSKSYKLRSYVMYLDADTLQRYATIRSKEAISLIEKQTQALFGRPDIRITQDGSIDTSNDEVIQITFSGLTMLVLEAVTFGSFLWDAEGYVESRYHFVKS